MRTIDADALTRELKSIKTTFGSGNGLVEGGLEIAISTTNAMPTVGEWIPCSERLPEREGRYLCTNDELGEWIISINIWFGDHWFYPDKKPIAWMPLPAPWKGERDD